MRVRRDRKDIRVTAACIVSLGVAFSVAQAASLKPEAAKAWEDYVESASGGIQERAHAPAGFLQIDATPAVAAKVHRGQIVVSPAAAQYSKKVPFGLIHDWIGTAFPAKATTADVVVIVRDYSRYTEIYAPHVLESRVISSSETVDLFSVVLMNRTVLSKTALDCDYETTFVRVDDRRMYSITQAKRIQEIADYGTAKQQVRFPRARGQDSSGAFTASAVLRNEMMAYTLRRRQWRSAATSCPRCGWWLSRLSAGCPAKRLRPPCVRRQTPRVAPAAATVRAAPFQFAAQKDSQR